MPDGEKEQDTPPRVCSRFEVPVKMLVVWVLLEEKEKKK
jgi:hypothetical protein